MTVRLPTAIVAATASILAATASGAFAQQAELQQLYHVGQNNDFGALQDGSVRRAAAAAPTLPLTAEQRKVLDHDFQVGRNNDFGAGQAEQPVYAQREVRSRFASTVPMVHGKPDIVGAGGHQDDLAREIYTPGHGTFFDR